MIRMIKYAAIGAVALCLVGGLLFGGDLLSYMNSSYRSVQSAVKDSVPMEFELQRARNLLDDIIPEMQANVRLIAQEEVEIAHLKSDIETAQRSLGEEKVRLARIRDVLGSDRVRYVLGGTEYTREQVTDDLARRFERVKEAEVVLAGKRRLQETREKSLHAAMQMLERTRAQKARLEDQIQGLESQYRLVQAAAVGSQVQIDSTKLAQTDKLIRDLRKRLDVAERVLAREAQFTQPIEIKGVDEKDLIAQVDEYLAPASRIASTSQPAVAMSSVER